MTSRVEVPSALAREVAWICAISGDAWRWALLRGYCSELPRWGVNVCGVVLQEEGREDVLRLQTHLHMLVP